MLRSYAKGALSYVLPSARNSHVDAFTVSAELSYSQYLRHLVVRSEVNRPSFGESVAEFGPGSSLGFGLAALVSGASHYQAYDIAAHFDVSTNLRIFDELVHLFRSRAHIPHEGEYVRIFPFIDDHDFPEVLSADWMAEALAPGRLNQIRQDIIAGGGETIRINIGRARSEDRPADWIASHSVLEHIDDLDGVYQLFGDVLAPSGVMTHLIDFSSHGLTDEWNGHWALGRMQWALLRGRRTYLINREPLETHCRLLRSWGMTIANRKLHRRVDGLLKDRFVPSFDEMATLDASTHMALLVCRRDERGRAISA